MTYLRYICLLLIFAVSAGSLNNLITLRDEKDSMPVDGLESYGGCLLPGIRGAAEWSENQGERFCKMMALPGAYDEHGKSCYLRTYNLDGVLSKERYRVKVRWYADQYQSQAVCRLRVTKREHDLLALKMKMKGQQPTLTTTSGGVKLAADKNGLRFSMSVPNDSSPDQIRTAAERLSVVASDYMSYYERPTKDMQLNIILSRKPLPEEERYPFEIGSTYGDGQWRFQHLDMLRDRDQNVLGMSPAQRKAIFASLITESSVATYHFKKDAQTLRHHKVIYRDTYVTKNPKAKIYGEMGISARQLRYVSREGDVLGWGSEIMDAVPESMRSVSFAHPSD